MTLSINSDSDCRSGLLDVSIGCLLYLSTVYVLSNAVLLIVLGLIALKGVERRVGSELVLVLLFSTLAVLNIVAHFRYFDFQQHGSSIAVVLVPIVAALAPALSVRAWKTFVVLVLLEIVVAVFLRFMGQVALNEHQASLAGVDLAIGSELLYFNRILGLSANSSILAEKIFLSLLLVGTCPGMFRIRMVPWLTIFTGLFLTFNRTAIISTCFFLCIIWIKRPKTMRSIGLTIVSLITVFVIVAVNMDALTTQFLRGEEGITESESTRLDLWKIALRAMLDNPLLGNGSLTFRIEESVTGSLQHAHNSLLMFFATHGLLVALPLVAYILINIHPSNWCPLLAMLVFSLTQYSILWNLSIHDFLLFWFLGKVRISDRCAT